MKIKYFYFLLFDIKEINISDLQICSPILYNANDYIEFKNEQFADHLLYTYNTTLFKITRLIHLTDSIESEIKKNNPVIYLLLEPINF